MTTKELNAIHAALDFIINRADGADEENYPHDIIDGLCSIRDKAHKEKDSKHFKYLVKRELKKIQSKTPCIQ